ncbi:hypothetical protein ACFFGT_23590 [Mucilaginibacter angelicae]|uniref:Beta-carotene 15,15'-monooxygenase n=1 Tax=Mucilaginibacter angelicae TaxID=869718 RepID=A0ABV6LCL5_9SPHI
MLFPRYFKIIGLILAIPSLILGLMFQSANYVIPFLNYGGRSRSQIFTPPGANNMTDELVTTALVLGLLFIGFYKQKNESPAIQNLRLKALFWAVLVQGFLASTLLIVFNSGIFKFDFISKYNSTVFNLILNNNLFILLIIFLSRFYYLLYGNKGQSKLRYISFRPLILASQVTAVILFILTLLASFDILPINQWDKAIFFLPPAILIWVWSGEKTEDTVIENIRLKAMLLSVIFNYSLFVVLTWVIYSIDYLAVLCISIASVPLIFIPIFYWLKFRHKQSAVRAFSAS